MRGWNVHEVASSPDRLKQPLLRKNGRLEPVEWDEAINYVTQKLLDIKAKHGPDALAFFNSPRCSNEESYLLQKLARAVIGTNNLEHGTGVYCNNSVDTLCEMIGYPATTNSIGELMESEVIVVDGVDLAMQLPTIGGWVLRAKLKGAKLIVIDARRQRVAESADYHLQLLPGHRVLLYGAMAKVIVDRGLMNLPFIKAHCNNYEAFLEQIRAYDLITIAKQCGVPAEQIEQAAMAYAQAKSAAILYSTGVAARSRGSIRALVNLALLTGNLGRPGSGLYALTEHNNLQGVCDMGMLPDRLPGYGLVTNPAARSRLQGVWQTRVPAQPGLGAQAVLEDAGKGRVKGVWLLRYDPVNTAVFCDAAKTLKQMELVVVQHLFMTSTAAHAHVVLPVVAFGEERVSFTSTDRRIQLAEKVIEPPLGPRPAWQQLTEIAQALGADWNYRSSGDVMEEICRAAPLYGGASHENLARDYGRQWPCTTDKPLGTRYLYEDGISGRPFKFAAVPKPATAGAPPEYPVAVIFGSSLYYWHQNVLVQHSETLKRELRVLLLDYPEGFVEVNDEDARQLGVRDGSRIRLVGQHGTSTTTARVTREVRSGTIAVPFFVKEVMGQIMGEGAFQAVSRTKSVFVRIEKA